MSAVDSALTRAPAARPALPMLWVNGHRVDTSTPHLSPLDRGFTLADGLFETMRIANGVVFRLAQHLARLAAGARVLAIELPPWLPDMVRDAVNEARAAGLAEGSARLTVSRGVGAPGLAPPPVGETRPTVVLTIAQLPAIAPTTYTQGLTAHIARGRRNEHSPTSGVKVLAYTDNVLALAAARAADADDALWLDTAGHVAEATASNIFLRLGDTLVTPPLGCGVLPGITRHAVIELAPALGLTVAERVVEGAELHDATEAFLTSSLRGVAPLVRVDGRAIGSGTVGPVTQRIMHAYAALVHRECEEGAR